MGKEREKDVEKEFVFIEQRKKIAREFYNNVVKRSKVRFMIDEIWKEAQKIDEEFNKVSTHDGISYHDWENIINKLSNN